MVFLIKFQTDSPTGRQSKSISLCSIYGIQLLQVEELSAVMKLSLHAAFEFFLLLSLKHSMPYKARDGLLYTTAVSSKWSFTSGFSC